MHEALIYHDEEMADARLEDLEQVGRNPGRLLSMIEEWVASHDGHARMSTTFGELWPLEDPAGPVSEHPLEGSLMELRRAIAGDPVLGSLSAERRSDLVFAINGLWLINQVCDPVELRTDTSGMTLRMHIKEH